jgi:hypothetical protein
MFSIKTKVGVGVGVKDGVGVGVGVVQPKEITTPLNISVLVYPEPNKDAST